MIKANFLELLLAVMMAILLFVFSAWIVYLVWNFFADKFGFLKIEFIDACAFLVILFFVYKMMIKLVF